MQHEIKKYSNFFKNKVLKYNVLIKAMQTNYDDKERYLQTWQVFIIIYSSHNNKKF